MKRWQEKYRLKRSATVIDLLRHGEVEGGACFRGSTDDPLSRAGWEQMEAAVSATTWECIVSSPLCRCADFARVLAARLDIPLRLDASLRELDFGQWEGQSAAELMQKHPQALAKFWQAPYDHPPPGAESLHLFEERVLAAWRDITHTHRGRRVLIITHGGVIRIILRQQRRLPPEVLLSIEVPHASLHRVVLANTPLPAEQ